MAKNSPVTICATRHIPSSDPKFNHPLSVDDVDRSTRASFAVLNRGCLGRMSLFISLCAVVVLLIY
jgi:hypothetical protein